MKIQSNENFNLSLSRMSPYMNRHRRSRLKLDGMLIFLLLNIHFINSKIFQQTNTLFLEFQLFILSYIRFPRIDSICVMNVFIISRRRIRDSWFKRSFFFFFFTTVKHWQSLATFSLITDHVRGRSRSIKRIIQQLALASDNLYPGIPRWSLRQRCEWKLMNFN